MSFHPPRVAIPHIVAVFALFFVTNIAWSIYAENLSEQLARCHVSREIPR